MKVIKLTDEQDQTRGGTQWGPGVTHTAPGTGELCTPGWVHCYDDVFVAVFMNPIHVSFANPHGWKAEAEGPYKRNGQLKRGCAKLTTLNRIELPILTTDQRVEIAIRCALTVHTEPSFVKWAENWLSGKDRSQSAAQAAAWAVAWVGSPKAAAWAAVRSAAWARSAAWTEAARSAAAAAWAAKGKFDLKSIIRQVVGGTK